MLKRTYWKVVKGLSVFLHSALVYSREKILPWKVNWGERSVSQIGFQEKFGWVCFCVAILVF